jgi:hypothetical protein
VKVKRLDLLLKEVKDPYSQENFWRLRQYIDGIDQNGIPGPTGATGATGPQGPPGTSASAIVLSTNVGTVATDLLYLTAANFVSKIPDNAAITIPHGIFGVALSKPTSTTVEVVCLGTVGGFSGLTAGTAQFISTSGGLTATPPSTGTVQRIGWALSTTELFVQLMQPMRRS